MRVFTNESDRSFPVPELACNDIVEVEIAARRDAGLATGFAGTDD